MSSLFSSKSSSSSTTTSKPIIPKNIQEALDSVLNQAVEGGLFNIADFTPDELAAFDLIRENIGQSPEAINQSLGYSLGLLGDRGGITNEDISYFMNPYTSGVIDPAIRELQSASERQRMSIQDAALAAGSFGGSRLGLLEQGLMSDTQRNIGDLTQKGLFDAYNAATGTALASKELGLRGAQGAAGFSDLLQKSSLLDAASLQNIGESIRGMEQDRLNIPLQSNQYLASLLGALGPMQIGQKQTSFSEQTQSGSPLNTILGAGAALAGLWNPAMFGPGGGGLSSLINSTKPVDTSGIIFGNIGNYMNTLGRGFADGGSVRRAPQLWEMLFAGAEPSEEDLRKMELQEESMRGNLRKFYDSISNLADVTPFSEIRDSSEESAATRSIRNFLRETANLPKQDVPPPLETAEVPARVEPGVTFTDADLPLFASQTPQIPQSIQGETQVQPQTQPSIAPEQVEEEGRSFFEGLRGQPGFNEPLLAMGLALMASDKPFGQAVGEAGLVGMNVRNEAAKLQQAQMKAARDMALEERKVAAQEMSSEASMMNALTNQIKAITAGSLSDSTINTVISEAFKAADTGAAQGLFEVGSPEWEAFASRQAVKIAQDAANLKGTALPTSATTAAPTDRANIRDLLDTVRNQ